MSAPQSGNTNSDVTSGRRWANALLLIATIAAVSGVLALLLRPEARPGIEVALPTPTPPPQLKVYVSGAVAQPGVYPFREGDRLQEAMHSAGGLLPGADASAVNMAVLLEDEQHHHIPLVRESKDDANSSTATPAASKNASPTSEVSTLSPDNPVDVNVASQERLQLLPGIGEVKAEAIIQYRESYGPFGETSEITRVPGIGPDTFENIRHLITVDTSIP